MKKKIFRYLTLTSAYLTLAILFTWPLATQLTTHGFGVDEDSPYHIWHNWWFKFSIFELRQSPLSTDYIFHPQNIPLVFDANAFVFSAFTLPLQLFMSVLTASNIVFIFSFVLSGIGAYVLTKHVLKTLRPPIPPPWRLNLQKPPRCFLGERAGIPERNLFSDPGAELASFITGVIYAFSPYTLAQAIDGHINLTSTWILPFYAYCLLKSLTSKPQPSTRETSEVFLFNLRGYKIKYAFAAGIFAGLQALNDLTYTAFTIIFTGLVVAYPLFRSVLPSFWGGPRALGGRLQNPFSLRFWTSLPRRTPVSTRRRRGGRVKAGQNDKIKKIPITGYRLLITILPPLTTIAAISLLIFLPVLIPTIKVYRTGLKPDAPLWVQNVWSADLIAFFRPNDHSTFLNPISYTPPRGTVEGTVFIGYTVLLLALIPIYKWLRSLIRCYSKRAEDRFQGTFRDRLNSDPGMEELGSRKLASLQLWIFLAASFFIFSLGPFLKIGDTWKWDIFGHQLPIPLPFIFLHKIPLIGGTQEPARMNPFMMLPIAILAANGICALFFPRYPERAEDRFQGTFRDRLNSDPGMEELGSKELVSERSHYNRKGILRSAQNNKVRKFLSLSLVFCLLSLTLLEFLQFPFPTTHLEPPPIYAEIAKDPEHFSILTLPVGFNSGQIALGKSPIGSLQYYQVIHQKPSFRGTVARLPAWTFDYYRGLPLFRIFIDPNRSPEPEDLDKKAVEKIFKDQLHIKYIVIHKDKFKNGLEKTKNLIEEVLEAEQIGETDRTISYISR